MVNKIVVLVGGLVATVALIGIAAAASGGSTQAKAPAATPGVSSASTTTSGVPGMGSLSVSGLTPGTVGTLFVSVNGQPFTGVANVGVDANGNAGFLSWGAPTGVPVQYYVQGSDGKTSNVITYTQP